MGWTDTAKYVLFGNKSNFKHTEQAIGDLGLGDLDYPTHGINKGIRNSHPHYNGSNRTKVLKVLADKRLDVFTVRQLAGLMRADATQIRDVLNELVAEQVLDKIQKDTFRFSQEMKETDFQPNSMKPHHQDDFRKMIEEQIFVLSKKIDYWASRIQTSNELQNKKNEPDTVISEFKGKILEIVNTLKVIEMPGSDRDLGEMIIRYKDARREGLIAREREMAYEVVDRLDGMVSVYLHLIRTYNEFNRYLIEMYQEGRIKTEERTDVQLHPQTHQQNMEHEMMQESNIRPREFKPKPFEETEQEQTETEQGEETKKGEETEVPQIDEYPEDDGII